MGVFHVFYIVQMVPNRAKHRMNKEFYKTGKFLKQVYLSVLNIIQTRGLKNETLMLVDGVLLMVLNIQFQKHLF